MSVNYANLPCLSEAEQAAIVRAWSLSPECAALESRQTALKQRISERSSCVSLGITNGAKSEGRGMMFDSKTVQRYPI